MYCSQLKIKLYRIGSPKKSNWIEFKILFYAVGNHIAYNLKSHGGNLN
jgi:hypothetical protein